MKSNRTHLPSGLSAEAKRWARQILAAYELEPHHVKILIMAAQQLDRGNEARAVVSKMGTTYTDRFGAPRLRPEVSVERNSMVAFARLVRELGLDYEQVPDVRPPRLGA